MSNQHILIADSDRLLLEITAEVVSMLGVKVTAVADCTEAFSAVMSTDHYDVALADAHFRGSCTGVDILNRLRTDRPATKIVLMVEHESETDIRRRFPEAASMPLLRKPFGITELTRLLGQPDGAVMGQPDGAVLGPPNGAVMGQPDGAVMGQPDGAVMGQPEDAVVSDRVWRSLVD